MKALAYMAFILMFIYGSISISQSISAIDEEWDYSNYLYSLKILSYDGTVTAGQSGSITVVVGSNTDVVLHVELKGEFDWDHWILSSVETQLEPNTKTVSAEVGVPYKTLIEPALSFYYYVYVALPGDDWSPSAWSLTETVEIIPPTEVSHEELAACMSQLKWLVYTSALPDGIRNSLFSKLEAAGDRIDSAYVSGIMDMLGGAIGPLNGFINMMESDNEASTYLDSGLWKDQASFIIDRIEIAIS